MKDVRLSLGFAIPALAVAAIAVVAVIGGGNNVRGDTGGPDSAGYTWFDSNAPEPQVAFDWIEPGTGAPFENVDDGFITFDVPFAFTFYGQDYTQVDVSTNGFMSFDVGNACNDGYNEFDGNNGQTIPANGNCGDTEWGGNPLIAGWFDDLDPEECGSVIVNTVGEAPQRIFVAEYSGICHNECEICDTSESVTFEILLFEGSNHVKLQYKDAFFGTDSALIAQENNGGTATVGINKDGATGLQYSANETKLTDNLAVLFTTGGLPTSTPTPTPTPTRTPTPSPTPTATDTPGPQLTQGDNNCDSKIQATDALAGLQQVAGLPVNQQPDCPTLGGALPAALPAGDPPALFGDVDCDNDVDAVDALKVLQFVAALPFTQNEPCTNIGDSL